MLRKSNAVWMFSTAIMMLGAGAAPGQNYPYKPIRIVAAAPGGSSDAMARMIAQGISGPLGQPVIVENKLEGVISLSAEQVSKALPDGYTLLVIGGNLWVGALQTKTPYDPIRDFSPITQISRQARILAAHPSLPAGSVKELIAMAKAKPGALNYATGGAGSTNHLAMEVFKDMAGVNIVHIPYKGSPPALAAVLGGEVQMGFFDIGVAMPGVKSGKLKALAVTSLTPSVFAPGVPTMTDSGLPGYERVGMNGVFAPARTPEPTVNRLNREIVRLLNQPETKERLFNVGEEVVASSPEQFASAIKSDMASISKVIKALSSKD